MNISQGDIHWIDFSPSTGAELKDRHPAVILQASYVNATAIGTVVVIRRNF